MVGCRNNLRFEWEVNIVLPRLLQNFLITSFSSICFCGGEAVLNSVAAPSLVNSRVTSDELIVREKSPKSLVEGVHD